MLKIAVPILLAAVANAQAQQKPSPEALLKACMDKYASMNSFSAHCVTSFSMGGQGMPAGADSMAITRDLKYQKPNRVLIDTGLSMGTEKHQFRIVSDGTNMLMYSAEDKEGLSDKAPASIGESTNPMMQNPMFSGSILKLFLGSSKYDSLVDPVKGAPTAGTEETTTDGQKALHVKFASQGVGNMDMLIGEDSKLLYASAININEGGNSIQLNEKFSDISVNPAIDPSAFDATPPKGVKVQTMADLKAEQDKQEATQDKPPVPLGNAAPDIKVYSLANGQPMKLSSLKGKVVLIDFWATWCPPCRESLPHTEDIFKKYTSHNVQVVTISDEDAATIRKFVKEQKYTFPTFRDPDGAAAKVYGITGIPTVVVVDAKGNLSAFLVGLREEDALVDALKKAGVN